MANFTARISAGATQENWLDPATATKPSRVEAAEWPLRRWAAAVGGLVTAAATVAGVEGELDVNLGGQLFQWNFAEWPRTPGSPGGGPPALVKTAGQSSVIAFTPYVPGHHTLVGRRANGGAVVLHVDAS